MDVVRPRPSAARGRRLLGGVDDSVEEPDDFEVLACDEWCDVTHLHGVRNRTGEAIRHALLRSNAEPKASYGPSDSIPMSIVYSPVTWSC